MVEKCSGGDIGWLYRYATGPIARPWLIQYVPFTDDSRGLSNEWAGLSDGFTAFQPDLSPDISERTGPRPYTIVGHGAEGDVTPLFSRSHGVAPFTRNR